MQGLLREDWERAQAVEEAVVLCGQPEREMAGPEEASLAEDSACVETWAVMMAFAVMGMRLQPRDLLSSFSAESSSSAVQAAANADRTVSSLNQPSYPIILTRMSSNESPSCHCSAIAGPDSVQSSGGDCDRLFSRVSNGGDRIRSRVKV